MNPIQHMLSGNAGQRVIVDLGIENDTPEMQAALLSMIGENIFNRVTLEILKKLPEDQHATFEAFLRSGDMEGFDALIAPYIPDLEACIAEEARKEYEATKEAAK